MKKTIKLNESQLHGIIKESVKRVLREYNDDLYDYYGTEGYSGIDRYGNYTGYVTSEESKLRSIYNQLCNRGLTNYDNFSSWKQAGCPGKNRL